MDESWFIPLWLQLAMVLAVVTLVLVFVLPAARAHMKGSGDWKGLAARYAAPPRKLDGGLHRRTLEVGQVLWRNCVTVGMHDDGLYLQIKTPLPFQAAKTPLLIPWSDITRVQVVRLYWQKAYQLDIGSPAVATITLPSDLYHLVTPRLASSVHVSA
jgi:hypothetical protein